MMSWQETYYPCWTYIGIRASRIFPQISIECECELDVRIITRTRCADSRSSNNKHQHRGLRSSSPSSSSLNLAPRLDWLPRAIFSFSFIFFTLSKFLLSIIFVNISPLSLFHKCRDDDKKHEKTSEPSNIITGLYTRSRFIIHTNYDMNYFNTQFFPIRMNHNHTKFKHYKSFQTKYFAIRAIVETNILWTNQNRSQFP